MSQREYVATHDHETADLKLNPKNRTEGDFPSASECKIIASTYILGRRETEENIPYIRYGKRISVFGAEKNNLEQFKDVLNTYNKPQLVGFNDTCFDLPVVALRSMAHGISLPELFQSQSRFENYDYRYSDVFSFDLRDTISRRRAAKIGPLDTLSQLVGFPGKTIASGDQVQSLYEAGEFEKISHYCDLDTLLTTAVFLRWSKTSGALSDEGFRKSARSFRNFLEAEAREAPHLAKFFTEIDWTAFELTQPDDNRKNFIEYGPATMERESC